jgi:archaemetzincin
MASEGPCRQVIPCQQRERCTVLVALMPVGKVDSSILETIGTTLGEEFCASCSIGQPLAHPDYAFNPERGQYLSHSILAQLSSLDIPADRILGVVDLDLYTPDLNFVFGQASMGGRVALIALPRLRPEFYGDLPDQALFEGRAIKEAIHELGHTMGLGHCPERTCVMHFSNSLADTDFKGRSFCPHCRARLRSIS